MPAISTHQPPAEQPFVSFIIPAYDLPAELLRPCVESIRTLSLRPTEREIIIVDDGSPTPLINLLTDVADELVYVRQPNQGVSVARNRGLLVAQGRFVQFVDGDDLLQQTAYEHVLDLARFGNTDMVLFGFTTSPTAATDCNFTDGDPVSGSELLRRQNIHGAAWGFLFRHDILGGLRFTPGISYGEDEEFTPQLLLRAERVCTTDAEAYYYRPRPASAIHSTDVRSRLVRLNNTKEVIVNLQKKLDTLPPDERLALQRRIDQLTMDYIHNIIVYTHDRQYLDRRLEELRQLGRFPLPDRNYTARYTWFRRLANNSAGLTLLMNTLPLIAKRSEK